MTTQQAVIITLDLTQAKTLDESIEEANAHITRLLTEGWRLMWATPFSGSHSNTVALMVLIERGEPPRR
jgi:3'-phosphoadenosine 5'-phosphosulfate sulfotransferase (PAPS reductase)/FAD synthetase